MTIDLHPKCRRRILDVIEDALSEVQISGRVFPDWEIHDALAPADDALPERDPATDALRSYIGDTPISTFIYGQLHRDLSEAFGYDSNADTVGLPELPGIDSTESLAESYVQRLETLPWSYELLVPLPKPVSDALRVGIEDGDIPLSPNLSLKVFSEDDLTSYPQPDQGDGPLQSLLIDTANLLPDRLTVVHEGEGYVDRLNSSMLVENFRFDVRSLLGLLISLRIISPGFSNRTGRQQQIEVYRLSENGRERQEPDSFSADFTSQFRTLQVDDDFKEFNPQVKQSFSQKVLERIALPFSDGDEHESLLRAAQWLFDGYCSGSSLLAFVQTTVTAEILLGEKQVTDLVGIENLLANRCAYLISDTKDQRHEIMRDFGTAYGIRSRIVHEGKNRLNTEERSALTKLRWMCYRVIQEELKLIKGDA